MYPRKTSQNYDLIPNFNIKIKKKYKNSKFDKTKAWKKEFDRKAGGVGHGHKAVSFNPQFDFLEVTNSTYFY